MNQKSTVAPCPTTQTKIKQPHLPLFPIEVFPKPVRAIVEAFAVSCCAATDIAACGVMSIISLALGPNWKIKSKSYRASSSLYVSVVAPPGSAKSPVFKALMEPVNKRETLLWDQYSKKIEVWKAECVAAKANKEPKPEKPLREQVRLVDFTPEALVSAHHASPLGLLVDADELVKLFAMIDKRGGRGTFLSLWSGMPISLTRKTTKDLLIPNPYCAVIGGIQPDMLCQLKLDSGDGMAQRFLWSAPTQPKQISGYGEEISSEVQNLWTDTIFGAFGKLNATIGATPEAIVFGDQVLRDFAKRTQQANEAKLSAIAGFYAKAPEHFHRIAACLIGMSHLFEGPVTSVSKDVFERAFILTEYFLEHGKWSISQALGDQTESADYKQLRKKDQVIVKTLLTILDREAGGTRTTQAWDYRLGEVMDKSPGCRSLGHTFKRLSEIPLPGILVKDAGRDGNNSLWKVTLTTED